MEVLGRSVLFFLMVISKYWTFSTTLNTFIYLLISAPRDPSPLAQAFQLIYIGLQELSDACQTWGRAPNWIKRRCCFGLNAPEEQPRCTPSLLRVLLKRTALKCLELKFCLDLQRFLVWNEIPGPKSTHLHRKNETRLRKSGVLLDVSSPKTCGMQRRPWNMVRHEHCRVQDEI